MIPVSFDNTEIAFKHKSDNQLRKSKWLFSLFTHPFIIKFGPPLAVFGLKIRLPIKGLIRNTIFSQFCGGESIAECQNTAKLLHARGIGSILDYSVEGVDDEESFDDNFHEIMRTIDYAAAHDEFPFAVFKVTGIARIELLGKVHANEQLNEKETEEHKKVMGRFEGLCVHAAKRDVRLFVDAEDSWIQDPIDEFTLEMMKRFNGEKAIIFNTLQMYRHDRIAYLEQLLQSAKEGQFHVGLKLVRGAYMEKERERASELGYKSPIQLTKEDTDRDYDKAVEICFDHREFVSICVGTHNDTSSQLLVDLIEKHQVSKGDQRFWFAQLFGMSDNISFNLGHAGYNVAKYLPYGPIQTVMPYLGRRAQENSSVAGQVGREMSLIVKELKRRHSN